MTVAESRHVVGAHKEVLEERGQQAHAGHRRAQRPPPLSAPGPGGPASTHPHTERPGLGPAARTCGRSFCTVESWFRAVTASFTFSPPRVVPSFPRVFLKELGSAAVPSSHCNTKQPQTKATRREYNYVQN